MAFRRATASLIPQVVAGVRAASGGSVPCVGSKIASSVAPARSAVSGARLFHATPSVGSRLAEVLQREAKYENDNYEQPEVRLQRHSLCGVLSWIACGMPQAMHAGGFPRRSRAWMRYAFERAHFSSLPSYFPGHDIRMCLRSFCDCACSRRRVDPIVPISHRVAAAGLEASAHSHLHRCESKQGWMPAKPCRHVGLLASIFFPSSYPFRRLRRVPLAVSLLRRPRATAC